MILEQIRAKLHEMPPNFRKIGSYILDNELSFASASVHTVSTDVGLSSATLVRFAKQLGLTGYQDLKKNVQAEISHPRSPYDKILRSDLDLLPQEMRLQKLFKNEYNNLATTFNDLGLVETNTILQGIKRARKIFITGFGMSQHLARLFESTLLSSMDNDIAVITGSVSDYTPRLKSFGPEDVMFILTFPPYSAEVKHVPSVDKAKGGSLYLFTDSANCPVYADADAIIRCASNSLLLENSFIGIIAVIQLLAHYLYLDSKDSSAESRRGQLQMEQAGYSQINTCKDTQ